MEVNTYWKIKDYEQLLSQRPTTEQMKDKLDDAKDDLTIQYKAYVEEELEKLKGKDQRALDKVHDIESKMWYKLDTLKEMLDKHDTEIRETMPNNLESKMKDLELKLVGIIDDYKFQN